MSDMFTPDPGKMVASVVNEVAKVLEREMSKGQVKVITPDLCDAVKLGLERYNKWVDAERFKLFSNLVLLVAYGLVCSAFGVFLGYQIRKYLHG